MQSLKEPQIYINETLAGSINLCIPSSNIKIFLPSLISKYESKVRSLYLEETGNFYDALFKDPRLSNKFQLHSGFNILWTNSIFEKSILKNPNLFNYVKAHVILSYLQDKNLHSVKVALNDKALQFHLIKLMKANNIEVLNNQFSFLFYKNFYFLKKILNIILIPLQGFFTLLKFIWLRRALLFVKPPTRILENNDARLCFFSYVSNFEHDLIEKNILSSNFWPPTEAFLKEDQGAVYFNWYTNNTSNFSPSKVNTLYDSTLGSTNHQFILIDTYLNLRVVSRSIASYLKEIYAVKLFYPRLRNFFFRKNKFSFLTILEDDFLESAHGKYASLSIIEHFIIQELFKNFKPDDSSITPLGALYICENQAWEKSINYFYRKKFINKIIGVVNNTYSLLDLRHAFEKRDSKTGFLPSIQDQVLPTHFAVQSNSQKNNYLRSFDASKIYELEAHRYNYLLNATLKKSTTLNPDNAKILIIGDYLSSVNKEMISNTIKAVNQLNVNPKIYFKSHPSARNFMSVNKEINCLPPNQDLKNLVTDFEILISSGASSSSLDINFLHDRCIVWFGESYPNLSALEECSNINIAFSDREIRDILELFFTSSIPNNDKIEEKAFNLMFLNTHFPRWRELILRL